MATDKNFWVIYSLTTDSSGDATEQKFIKGLIRSVYVDYGGTVAATSDVTVTVAAGGSTITLATETDNNTDKFLTLSGAPFPCDGHVTVTVAQGGDTQSVTAIVAVE